MNAEMQTKVQVSPAQSFMPAQTGLLQRKSALCNTPGLVEDSGRDKENLTLQRSSVYQAGTTTVPPIVHDFSRVSVHSTGPGMIQTKLKINEPGDIYEQEADRVADVVMQMPVNAAISEQVLAVRTNSASFMQRQMIDETLDEEEELVLPDYDKKEDGLNEKEPEELPPILESVPTRDTDEFSEEDEEELIQPKSNTSAAPRVTPGVARDIQSLIGSGQVLPPNERAFFETRFGYDFGGVRIHTNDRAAAIANELNASAFTLGANVVFGAGRYAPDSASGRRLMAHELAHVVQQGQELQPRIQRYLQGCSQLLAESVTATLITGQTVHNLIETDFLSRVPGALRVMIPGASAGALRSQGLCEKDTKVVRPQLTGGRAGAGYPDLARVTPGRILQVAEIKPATLSCLIDGENQLLRYIDQGNGRDPQQTAWRASMGVRVVAPVLPSTYLPPALVAPGVRILTAWCNPGLMVYSVQPLSLLVPVEKPLRVKSPDYPLLLMLVAGLAALLKQFGKRANAVAAMLATLYLLASGRAEARPNMRDKDPVDEFFRSMAQQGSRVPPELRKRIEGNAELRDIIKKSQQRGKLTEAQKELSDKIMKLVNDNIDQFSDEELKKLLEISEEAQNEIPNGELTVEVLKKALAHKDDSGVSSRSWSEVGESNASNISTRAIVKHAKKRESAAERRLGKVPPSINKVERERIENRLASVQEPVRRLIISLLSDSLDDPMVDSYAVERLLHIVNIDPPLADPEVDKLINRVSSAAGLSLDEVLKSIEKAIAKLRARSDTKPEHREKPSSPLLKSGKTKGVELSEEQLRKIGIKFAKAVRRFRKIPVNKIILVYSRSHKKDIMASGLLVIKHKSGVLIGGFVNFTPKKYLGRRKWLLIIEPGWLRFNHNGAYLSTRKKPISLKTQTLKR